MGYGNFIKQTVDTLRVIGCFNCERRSVYSQPTQFYLQDINDLLYYSDKSVPLCTFSIQIRFFLRRP